MQDSNLLINDILNVFEERGDDVALIELHTDSNSVNLENVDGNNDESCKLFKFKDIGTLVKRMAAGLQSFGPAKNEVVETWPIWKLGKRTIVAVLLDHGYLLPCLLLSALLSGNAFLPLDRNDPISRTVKILEQALKDKEVEFLVVEEEARVAKIARYLPRTKFVTVKTLVQSQFPFESFKINPKSISHIYMTSGSTGNPKGCIVNHFALNAFLQSKISSHQIDSHSKVLIASPHTFDPYLGDVVSTWSAGATLVITKTKEMVWMDMESCLKHVTHVTTTPAIWSRVKNHHSVQVVALGGETMSTSLVNEWKDKVKLYNTYGVTECCVYQDLSKVESSSDANKTSSGFPTSPLYFFGDNGKEWDEITTTPLTNLQQLNKGTAEIVIAGNQVGLGYWQEKSLTLNKFLLHPSLGPCFRTGDLAEWNQGWKILGRSDSQTKIRGRRVDLGEIEQTLLQNFPMITQVVVTTNQGLIAWCLGEASSQDLIQKQLEHLLPGWMIPNAQFVDEFFYTTSGKVDRKMMSTLTIQEEEWQDHGGWSNVLVQTTKSLGMSPWKDFNQTGGDSFTALRLCKALMKSWKESRGEEIPLDRYGETLDDFAPLELLKRPKLFDYAQYLHHTFGSWDGDNFKPEVVDVDWISRAILANAPKTVKYLMENDLISRDSHPLHVAVKVNESMVDLLKGKYSFFDKRQDGSLPLHHSVNGPVSLIKNILIAMTKSTPLETILQWRDEKRQTVLHYATRMGSPDAVLEYLISLWNATADFPGKKKPLGSLDVKDSFGRTPLHWAVLHGHATLVSLLLIYGADPKCIDDAGESCLDMAERRARCGAQERGGRGGASVWGDIAKRLGGSGQTKNVSRFIK